MLPAAEPSPSLSPADKPITDVVIDIVSDVVCPWCYVGKRKLEAAVAQLKASAPGIAIARRWHPFQLNPDMPPTGIPRADYVEAKFGSKARYVEINARVRGVGAEVGIPFDFDRIARQPNSLDAHRLIAWGQQQGDAAVADALVEMISAASSSRDAGWTIAMSWRASLARRASTPTPRVLSWHRTRCAPKSKARTARRASRASAASPFHLQRAHRGVRGARPSTLLEAHRGGPRGRLSTLAARRGTAHERRSTFNEATMRATGPPQGTRPLGRKRGVAPGEHMSNVHAQLESRFQALRSGFESERVPALRVRLDRLTRLATLTERHEEAIVAAIAADFGTRSSQETRLAELFMVSAGIRHMRRHLARWMAARRVPTPLYLQPGVSRIVRQPLGVVGVIGPWNYPFQLALGPAAAALAAGNRVMLKPSEHTPRTSALMRRWSRDTFPPEVVTVVTGGPEIGAASPASLRSPAVHRFDRGRSQGHEGRGRTT